MPSEKRWRITVDETACIGSGVCVGDRPDRFQLVHGTSQPVEGEIDADDEILAVADSCPREAIQVVEISTGTVLAPVD
ncbi:ferredoxin [Streptomyces sp. 8L]|uniref:ferredoxin n=1 Tax=unclassified Streptomyces TaxID=2593676 RepID=UPI001CD4EB93|nr:ferredoxin [Streptomyces sp. 8L]MCA1218403.1 ferredoxin [Streptomyces sp. 8L]